MLVIVSMCVSVCMCVFPNARMTPKICANCNHVVVHMYISEGNLSEQNYGIIKLFEFSVVFCLFFLFCFLLNHVVNRD